MNNSTYVEEAAGNLQAELADYQRKISAFTLASLEDESAILKLEALILREKAKMVNKLHREIVKEMEG